MDKNSLLDQTTSTAVDSTMSSVATKAMGGGATTAAAGWVFSNEGIAALGFGLTILGFIINFIFQVRRDRREAELQQAKLELLREGQKVDGE